MVSINLRREVHVLEYVAWFEKLVNLKTNYLKSFYIYSIATMTASNKYL